MGKIKDQAVEKAERLQWELASAAQAKFYNQVMEWEGCDYETAVKMCTGESDPIRPEYTLGLKLADPLLQLSMSFQGKKRRAEAVERFRSTLTPEELKLYDEQVAPMSMGKKFKAALKKAK